MSFELWLEPAWIPRNNLCSPGKNWFRLSLPGKPKWFLVRHSADRPDPNIDYGDLSNLPAAILKILSEYKNFVLGQAQAWSPFPSALFSNCVQGYQSLLSLFLNQRVRGSLCQPFPLPGEYGHLVTRMSSVNWKGEEI